MFTVSLCPSCSLFLNTAHELDLFESRMIMIDVDMCPVCRAAAAAEIRRAGEIAARLVGGRPFESGLHLLWWRLISI